MPERHKLYLEHIPDVLYELDCEDRFVFISEAIRLFGHTPESLQNKHFSELIHPDDLDEVDRTRVLPKFIGKVTGDEKAPKLFNERRSRERMTKNLEVRIKVKRESGEQVYHYVEVHATGLWGKDEETGDGKFVGVVGIFRDISHRKELESLLITRERKKEAILNAFPGGILVVDEEDKLLYMNKEAELILEEKFNDIKAKPINLPIDRGRSVEIEIYNKKGDRKIIEMMSREFGWYDKKAYIVSLIDHTKAVVLRDMLIEYSIKDDMTGLYNRRGFFILAEQSLKLVARENEKACLLFVDVDDLKYINDRYGHANGDLALVTVASVLKRSFRKSDILSRIGGDEFAALASISKEENVELLIGRIESCMDIVNEKKVLPFSLSISIGIITCSPEETSDIAKLTEKADKMMYEAKKRKRTARY